MPLLVFIVAMLAVSLSKVTPRQGRFSKLLPSILLYLIYVALLIAAQNALEKGSLPAALGLWLVHGVFFAAALVISNWGNITLVWRRRQLMQANSR